MELSGDVGVGKTALTKGIAEGFGSHDEVASPSFTLSRVYDLPNGSASIHHYDFYRLQDAGIMEAEIAESISDQTVAVVVEWADLVLGVLPEDRLKIEIEVGESSEQRNLFFTAGKGHSYLLEGLA